MNCQLVWTSTLHVTLAVVSSRLDAWLFEAILKSRKKHGVVPYMWQLGVAHKQPELKPRFKLACSGCQQAGSMTLVHYSAKQTCCTVLAVYGSICMTGTCKDIRQTDRQTNRQTDRQTDGRADRPTDLMITLDELGLQHLDLVVQPSNLHIGSLQII